MTKKSKLTDEDISQLLDKSECKETDNSFRVLKTIDILGQIALCCRGCYVYYRKFSCMLGLYLLDASRPPP